MSWFVSAWTRRDRAFTETEWEGAQEESLQKSLPLPSGYGMSTAKSVSRLALAMLRKADKLISF
jgi:pantoate kinase